MKKILTLALLLLTGLGVYLYSYKTGNTAWSGYTSTYLAIEGKRYHLWVADTENKHYQGLSDIHSLGAMEGRDGMIFEFPDAAVRSFVNRRTYIDLIVVWLKNDEVIGMSRLPRLQDSDNQEVVVNSPSPVDSVVELLY